MCSSVDLPDPDGPMTATTSPRATSSDTPRSASTPAPRHRSGASDPPPTRQPELRLPRVPVLRRRLFSPGLFRGARSVGRCGGVRHRASRARADCEPARGKRRAAGGRRRPDGRSARPTRPPWELWFVTQRGGDRIGIVVKGAPRDRRWPGRRGDAVVVVRSARRGTRSGALRVVARARAVCVVAVGRQCASEGPRGAAGGEGAGHPLRAAWTAGTIARILLHGPRGVAATRSSIDAMVAPGRRVQFARFDLAEVKKIAHASGGKVSDVVLDLSAGALRELLLARGERVDGVDLVASIPVALRTADQARALGNAIGVIAVPVPVGRMDARRRLESIIAATREAKERVTPIARPLGAAARAGSTVREPSTQLALGRRFPHRCSSWSFLNRKAIRGKPRTCEVFRCLGASVNTPSTKFPTVDDSCYSLI